MELLDELSPAARLIGAVNTVVNDNGRLTGYNTDGVGYMQAVRDAGYDVIGKPSPSWGPVVQLLPSVHRLPLTG